MKTTWIDLTDIELWPGTHGGTQRVVYGIAKEYYLSESESIRFFSYSPTRDVFYETSFAPIFNRVEKAAQQAFAVEVNRTDMKHKAKLFLLHYSPEFLRNNAQFKNRVKANARYALATYRKAKSAATKMKVRSAVSEPVSTPVVFGAHDIVLILGKPWDNPGLQKLLFKQKQNRCTVVSVVYDLIISLYPHLHHPSLFTSYTRHMFDAVQISDLMLPISHSSQTDLKVFCKKLQLPIPETAVIRLGDELGHDIASVSSPDERITDGNFILCVGTLENRKNHTLLYQAYKLAAEKDVDLPPLVIVGSKGWLTDDIVYVMTHDPLVKDKIIILHGINDSGLTWLYENCLFTVYPSLYEGWGLPVAESLARHKLCLASHVSSIPEIGGELAVYFSPYDSAGCFEALRTYGSDAALLKVKEDAIKEQYRVTTWRSTYDQVTAKLQKL